MKPILTCIALLCACTVHLSAQNLFPTAKNTYVKIDGGGVDLISPVTTGGWARGISFYTNQQPSIRAMAMGMFGSAEEVQRFYMAFGSSPYNSKLGLYILPNGNTGIGTIDPQAKLAVDGNILAKEVKVKTDITVPDYVFEPDYELPTLQYIESYVKEHKHLPEIPSAADIQRDGLDLAEMNLLLLKKVEEITLLLIEKEKVEKVMKADFERMKIEIEQLKTNK
ncbi:hypothetical protein [Parapedobacter tibetensis]|uniref:hypothetical protein n=1 Tax=Parapedobacter tibetensis TaxID=2972951 RepID=UPI00214DC691|nr:hypothetical protein [Parapedobacter tibetensis]